MQTQMTPEQIEKFKNAPRLTFGKYKGKRVTEVPMSYLRWMLGQKFSENYLEYARLKVGVIRPNIDMDITGHAIDQFSLRYLKVWLDREDKEVGLHRFVMELALKALAEGEDKSKHRFFDDKTCKLYQGMKFVFNTDGELKALITVM